MEKTVNRLLVLSAALAVLFGAAAFFFRSAEHDSAQTGDVLLPMCEYINIDILRLDVTVMPYDGDMIRVWYKNELPLDIELGDNELFIEESDKFVISLFAGSEEEFGLYLYLPREVYREVKISTGAGNVNVGGIDSDKISVFTSSGNITCENVRSLSDLITDSGYITLDFESVVPECTVQSRSGDASIIFPQGSSVALDFETELGECVTDLISGSIYGSYIYSFNGGRRLIHAYLEKGTLTVSERG